MKGILIGLMLLYCMHAQAEVTVVEPWVRATAPGQKVAAAYLRMVSDKDAKLVAANSPFADKVELHDMHVEDGIMKMRPIQALPLTANQPVELKPGGLHLMLHGIKAAVQAGDTIPITLVFEDKQGKRESVALVFNGRALTGMVPRNH
ncbi:copper chaperone PCu(A)C [Methylobacillus caricis]|uniref:copper chaperone PCu(A)C n=1 Tax=Methylobacillus caricis TaxID=1971611 RepID=UPI001CFF7F19|nr:copper chaperone PCu(A)C [Methylobacillus caricis]MCB5187760.1 copper chaperone PCu(A)C [Methylobacillus caricis]